MSLLALIALMVAWSGVLWLGASLLCRLSPAPKTAQFIWRIAALLMPAPLLLSYVVPGLPQALDVALPDLPMLDPIMVTPAAAEIVDTRPGIFLPNLGTVIIAVLVAGWALRIACWLRGQARLQTVKRTARASEIDAVNWAVALGLSDEPEVRLIKRGSAFVAGLKGPIIYVPEGLASTADVQQILAHECVHLKQGDLFTRPIERLFADLFWFSPFAWAMRERLDYWREAVTDEAAAALTGDRISYARALTVAARFARPSRRCRWPPSFSPDKERSKCA